MERELSLHPDSRLYYSFYKELVSAPSMQQGMYPRTITQAAHLIARNKNYSSVTVSVTVLLLDIDVV